MKSSWSSVTRFPSYLAAGSRGLQFPPVTGSGYPVPLPENLARATDSDGRTDWLQTLAGTIEQAAHEWSLTVGPPFEPGGSAAWVAPAHRGADDDLVLKIGWRHDEAFHEAAGLQCWAGGGAVRLYASMDVGESIVLLLECCVPGTPLTTRPEPFQDRVVADLLSRLWRTPPSEYGFRSLQVMCDMWADSFDRRAPTVGAELDSGLVREGVELFRALPGSADRHVLLCTDLHASNVLAAEREPWLMIDPKPYIGDPTYDALQHMLNCAERLHNDPHGLAIRMADLLDLDRDRLLRWLFARCVLESLDEPALAEVARRIAPA
jgi:streptomycin 6-kinase